MGKTNNPKGINQYTKSGAAINGPKPLPLPNKDRMDDTKMSTAAYNALMLGKSTPKTRVVTTVNIGTALKEQAQKSISLVKQEMAAKRDRLVKRFKK